MNPFVDGALNGWQFSGITQVESGANLTFGGSGFSQNQINGAFNVSYTCVAATCPQSGAIIPGSNTLANPKGIAINNQSIYGTNLYSTPSGVANPNPIVTCDPRGHLRPHQFVNGNCFAAPTVPGVNNLGLLPAAYGPAYLDSDLAVFKNFAVREGMKLQLRMQAYNFLNHPLWSFPQGGSNLNLNFIQDPASQAITQSNANFGVTTQKQGQRILEFGAKFYF
jgi:hypothetical protein